MRECNTEANVDPVLKLDGGVINVFVPDLELYGTEGDNEAAQSPQNFVPSGFS
jgi:hypothetical protein